MNDNVELKVEQQDSVTVVAVNAPRLTCDMGESFENGILRETQQLSTPKILLDFSDVRFLSSSILGKLVKLNARIAAGDKGQFKICNLSDRIAEVFHITGLEKLFQIYKTRAEALADFS